MGYYGAMKAAELENFNQELKTSAVTAGRRKLAQRRTF